MPLVNLTCCRRSCLLAAVVTLAAADSVRAQFTGGSADGFAFARLEHVSLDGGAFRLSPAYTASVAGGDGYSNSGRAFVPLSGPALPAAVYSATITGGDGYSVSGRAYLRLDGAATPAAPFTATLTGGDGYAFAGLTKQLLNGAAAVVASFKGGAGDGYDRSGKENVPIDVNAARFAIYNGGAGDGYDGDGFIHTQLGTPLPEGPYTAGLSGGDGYDSRGLAFVSLNSGPAIAELYLSSLSGGDGYDRSGVSFVSLSGAVADAFAFLGRAGDGYSLSGFFHYVLNQAAQPPVGLFTGNSGDGYDSRLLPFVQYLGGGEAASGITFAGWLNSRFSEDDMAAGMGEPNADPDGRIRSRQRPSRVGCRGLWTSVPAVQSCRSRSSRPAGPASHRHRAPESAGS